MSIEIQLSDRKNDCQFASESGRTGQELSAQIYSPADPQTARIVIDQTRSSYTRGTSEDDIFKLAAERNNIENSAPEAQTEQLAVPVLSLNEFSLVAKQVLQKVAPDRGGEVSREQLAKALEDPSYSGKEAQALAALYGNFDALHNLSGRSGWIESKRITQADLDKFAELQKAQMERIQDAAAIKAWAHESLNKFTAAGSGSIHRSDIESALKDPQTSQTDRILLETLQKRYSEIGQWWQTGINIESIDQYDAKIAVDTSSAKAVSDVRKSCYDVNIGQKPDISHELYGDSKYPIISINASAILQGSIGDCFFLASLAAVAQSNPQKIKDAIRDNHDGTYTVTFPGAKDDPITIKGPTQAEQGLYNHASRFGIWASVMEKAYGAYRQQSLFHRLPSFNLGGGGTPSEGAAGGGDPDSAMELLTGSKISDSSTTSTNSEALAASLDRAFHQSALKAVTASTKRELPFTDTKTIDHFSKGHSYTVVGFTPDGKGAGVVSLRNTSASYNGTGNDLYSIPLDKLISNFNFVSIEQ